MDTIRQRANPIRSLWRIMLFVGSTAFVFANIAVVPTNPPVFAASAHASDAAQVAHQANLVSPYDTCGQTKCSQDCGGSAFCTPPLVIHLGNATVVQHHPHVHLVFWGTKWQSSDPIIQQLITTFSSLSGSSYNAILTQYFSNPNRQDSYVLNDVLFNPQIDVYYFQEALGQNNLDMNAIGQAAAFAVNQQGWTTTTDDQFLVFPQQGETYDSSMNGGCGAHNYNVFQVRQTQYALAFGYVRYLPDFQSFSFMCDYGNQGGKQDFSTAATHEYAEMVTDPQPTSGVGWFTNETDPSQDREIGDLCTYGTASSPDDPIIVATYLWSNADNGCVLKLGNSKEFSSPNSPGRHTVKGKIYTEYSNPTLQSALGQPLNEEYPVPGFEGNPFTNLVRQQDFQNGSIYWKTGNPQAYEVQGAIHQKYISPAIGGPTGKLGFPVTDEQPIANGRVSYFAGQSCNGGGPNGSGSAIYFNGNAFEVQGCIYNKYQQGIPDQSGGSGPTSKFGFPVTDEQDIAGGKVSYFAGTSCNGGGPNNSGSAIYFNGTAIEVHGCIYHEYATVMGGPSQAGGLGFPTTDEKTIGGGYVSYFAGTGCNSGGPTGTGSAIYSISGLGTHTVKGCIYQEYVQNLGGPTHEYGFPTSEEMPFNGGKVSYFTGTGCTSGSWQGTGSAIMFGAGTFGVKGCIYQMYQQYISDTGNPLSTDLGLPTSEESPTFSGAPGSTLTAKVSIFQHGAIYFYTNAVGEYEVQGNIYNAYFSAGAEFSNCGLPTSNEYIVPNTSPQQRASNFENGIITYIPGVGTQINC